MPIARPGSAIPISSRSRSRASSPRLTPTHLRALISPDRARPAADIRPGEPQRYESDQTTHFSIVDSDGNAVANTYTLNLPYGCGLVADGTGVLLNNELDDFAAKPGAANVYGLMGGDANAPGPMKRPLSSMSPTLVFKDGKLDDGDRQPRRLAHHHDRAADHRQRDRPRAQRRRGRKTRRAPTTSSIPTSSRIERGISPDTIRLLEAMGHKVVVSEAMGSANTIVRAPDGELTGASDLRQRGTLAVGY